MKNYYHDKSINIGRKITELVTFGENKITSSKNLILEVADLQTNLLNYNFTGGRKKNLSY